MSEKLCVFCTQLEMDTSGCGGEHPDPANFSCRKQHFYLNFFGGLDDFRKEILRAETCPDYDQAKP